MAAATTCRMRTQSGRTKIANDGLCLWRRKVWWKLLGVKREEDTRAILQPVVICVVQVFWSRAETEKDTLGEETEGTGASIDCLCVGCCV